MLSPSWVNNCCPVENFVHTYPMFRTGIDRYAVDLMIQLFNGGLYLKNKFKHLITAGDFEPTETVLNFLTQTWRKSLLKVAFNLTIAYWTTYSIAISYILYTQKKYNIWNNEIQLRLCLLMNQLENGYKHDCCYKTLVLTHEIYKTLHHCWNLIELWTIPSY